MTQFIVLRNIVIIFWKLEDSTTLSAESVIHYYLYIEGS